MNFFTTKLLFAVVVLSAAVSASAGSANGKTYKAQDNSIETGICVAAASASIVGMNQAVDRILPSKFLRVKYEMVANKLKCNGINVIDFAAKAGNNKVATKLRSYRTKHIEVRDIAATSIAPLNLSGE